MSEQPPRTASVRCLPMDHPADVTRLRAAVDAGEIDPASVVAVLAKTEGNGLDNDFSRPLAIQALEDFFAQTLEIKRAQVGERVALIVSGGTEGLTEPAMWVFTASPAVANGDAAAPALAIGRGFSAPLDDHAIGGTAQIEATVEAVHAAMADAAIARLDEVRFVQVKSPLPDIDVHAAKATSRGASALGVGVALGEMEADGIDEAAIGRAYWPFTTRAGVTAGMQSKRVEALVFGMSPAWAGQFAAASGTMVDMLDVHPLHEALRELGIASHPQVAAEYRQRIAAVLIKGEPRRDGRLRERRHTMWRDSDVHALRHFRAAMSGVLGAILGDTRFYASAGAEHQGPPGGVTFVVFARRAAAP